MKTFKEILDLIYSQPEIAEEHGAFSDYTTDQIIAVQSAIDEIWAEAEYSFRDRSTTFNTVAGTVQYDLPYGRIKKNGLKESTSTSPMQSINNADDLPTSSGKPNRYWVEVNKLNLYPTPDDAYIVKMKYYTNYKGKAGSTEKDMLVLEDDVLNIPAEIERLFLNCLCYKTTMIKNADPTDEIYQHAEAQYARTLNLLKNESVRTSQSLRFVY